MSIRMHEYDDGKQGLAAFCDVCDEQIQAGDGYIVWDCWNADDWLLVHQVRCDPGLEKLRRYQCSSEFGVEIIHLAHSAGITDLETTERRARILAEI